MGKMTTKEMKKLKRHEMLEMMLIQAEEIERQKEELESLTVQGGNQEERADKILANETIEKCEENTKLDSSVDTEEQEDKSLSNLYKKYSSSAEEEEEVQDNVEEVIENKEVCANKDNLYKKDYVDLVYDKCIAQKAGSKDLKEQDRRLSSSNKDYKDDTYFRISEVLLDANDIAKDYILGIEELKRNMEEISKDKIATAQSEADTLILDASKKSSDMVAEARRQADLIVSQATQYSEKIKKEADEYWDTVSDRLEKFFEEHKELEVLFKKIK